MISDHAPLHTPLARAEALLKGRRVVVTGHTGFCGGWLALWLNRIGCKVTGIALEPNTNPNLFGLARIERLLEHRIVDIRNEASVSEALNAAKPEAVFHLAAQPLVRRSYRDPTETFSTNVMGTANVLNAARNTGCRAVLVVTTDKVYRNNEMGLPFRESNQLGGHDPYSASKACAELVAASFRLSFPGGPAIATARGGNIIGGGDWSEDRLIPDFVRAAQTSQRITLRNPHSTRPWQHVLALCSGYISIAAALIENPELGAQAWNIGPDIKDAVSVADVIAKFQANWRPIGINFVTAELHEAKALSLDSSMARTELGWRAAWNLEESVRATAEWYRDVIDHGEDAQRVCETQIDSYLSALSQSAALRNG